MTADRATALVPLLVIASGVPLGRLVPGPLRRRRPADPRGACPPHCTTCTALNEGDAR
ncbi:hypothetical protein [Streptomyces rapamycinicus]|uniref:Uncharacterized protein n=2 Tax=Streptomyces rapamycinicus TaxID=1226757 RepID=A0A0A0NQR8_STRRN|nr:hypothetical protein [Streptomyces rapamycinicus]AGP56835.1 hypothetical protein M271_26815 [Streptomyces rapamycinicus NRRL 5491]MBB4784451.1 hypothetical protein [Streptomyces rapamycinicus]RLV80066.1 hypothetical protein D3C57_116815 [Streptomyces rapamycinicus NRRL 5491]UTO64759.1 hypothetical protein LJB45_22130 [Streptomyces rapamycinicus]UTP32716.1 hypothetical protein LIV37_27255 [Streptomyces rapamycinicus NRRL 5491]